MEYLPLGPVLFVDTAGIDDEGILGENAGKETRRLSIGSIWRYWFWPANGGNLNNKSYMSLNREVSHLSRRLIKSINTEPSAETIKNLESNNIRWVKTRATKVRASGATRMLLSETPADFLEPRGFLSI
jgi:hypothetical protein